MRYGVGEHAMHDVAMKTMRASRLTHPHGPCSSHCDRVASAGPLRSQGVYRSCSVVPVWVRGTTWASRPGTPLASASIIQRRKYTAGLLASFPLGESRMGYASRGNLRQRYPSGTILSPMPLFRRYCLLWSCCAAERSRTFRSGPAGFAGSGWGSGRKWLL